LQIKIEFNDRYGQAGTYHNLGVVAQEQGQWQQAEQYYQQALQIKIEYNDRHSQASTYGQLGLLVQEQQQWQQAGEYLLQALQIFMEYKDNHSADIALRNLARLWKASDNVSVRASIAEALGKSVEETEKLQLQALGEWEEKQTGGSEKKE
jgi:tetratricopeptide (TPR) repeat protein